MSVRSISGTEGCGCKSQQHHNIAFFVKLCFCVQGRIIKALTGVPMVSDFLLESGKK